MQFLSRQLRAAQDEPDLRAVPMRQEHIPALFDHARHVFARFNGGGVLIVDRLMLRVLDERVAADGDNRDLAHGVLRFSGLREQPRLARERPQRAPLSAS
jgi:hypothetical protein